MSNDIFIKSKAIPSNPRSKNYPAGTSIVRSGGGTTTITGGGGTSVDILKVDDVRSLTDRNVFSSLRTLAEILSRIIKKDDTDTELSDENTLSSLRVKAAIDTLKDEYISKTAPDETEYLLKTLGGLIVNNGLDVTDGISTDTLTAETITTQLLNVLNKLSAKSGTFSEDLTVSKRTTTLNLLVQELADTYDLTVSHVATLMGTIVKEYISSESFVSGLSGEGMKIYKALNGDWNMEIDNLTVRKIFSVFELTVQKITHQGGMVIRSAAGAKLTKVTDGGSYWKCEHDSTDDFVKDDQIICQAFTGTSTKRYWRLVTSSGAGYFNLSKTDCEEGSATPEPGDEVAVLGNRTVSARQKAQIDCAVGDTAPYRDDYDGINSYSLVGKLITRTGNLSGITDAVFGVLSGSGLYGTNVYLKGTFILKSGKKIEEAIADVENNLSTRITTVETSFEIREGQISSKVTEATTAATNAKKSETNASGSASSAAGSATTAGQKASEASGSATSAAGSASNAAKSATDAQGAASNAGKILEEVTLKESSITQTAGQISTKVTEVNKKVTEAETAASNAKKSETNASGSATTASTKAGEAASSATNAKASENAAASLVANADGKFVTKTVYESGIKALSNSIELKVAKTDFNALGSRVSSAESSITAQAGQIQSKASQTSVNALTGRMETAESSITHNAQQISLKVSATEAGSIADGKVNALKGDLQATGIDIANRKVTVTADTFRVQDNYGNAIAVFKTDATGKPVVKAENIDVDNLTVKKLDGATGSFKELQAVDKSGVVKGKITFSASGEDVPASLNFDFLKTWFSGDLYQQGYNYDENRVWRFYTSDLWCRGEFGHRKMTTLEINLSTTGANCYFHLYGNGSDTTYHKYSLSGKPIDCIVLKGDANYYVRIMDSPSYKMFTIVNESNVNKTVICSADNSFQTVIQPWRNHVFVTRGTKYNGAVYANVVELFAPGLH